MPRLETLRKKVAELGYGAYFVADEMNIRYLTGLPRASPHGLAVLLLVKADGDHIIYVGSHFLRTARSKVGNECEVKCADVGTQTLSLLIADLPHMNVRRIGFDHRMSGEVYLRLTELAKNIAFVPDQGLMWSLRMIKSADEIENIRRAAKIADEGQRVAAEVLRPGMREYEVAAKVEYAMRILGSEDSACPGHPVNVSSGLRSSTGATSGFSTDRIIGDGDLVIVDIGATVNQYRSDLGRTYVAGKPSPKQKEFYELVRKAWSTAFSCVKPGAVAGDVDAAARKVFGEHEKWFNDDTGHGLGLTFREPPSLAKNSKDVLKENMVVVVEPGLYIEGFGGIMIEEAVLVVSGGAERLHAPPLEWN